MSFDPMTLLLGFVFGTFGFALFRWGKKQGRMAHMVGGIALMVAPYFCSGALSTAVVGCGIGAAVYVAGRLGW